MSSRICQTLSEVVANSRLTDSVYLLTVRAPGISAQAQPGQFVHVRVGRSFSPLLRRPFSVHWVEGETLQILYQVVGMGTDLLSRVRTGETVDLIGPLGRGFDLEGAKSPLIVAGGLGVAPLLFLAQNLPDNASTALIGAATKGQILCKERLEELGTQVRVATEDGSLGTKGVVTDLLNSNLSSVDAIFACGPRDMLKVVKETCHNEAGLPTQISLEGMMGCGVGACLGCAVKSTRGGYGRVCSDGPVFDASEVIL